MHIDNHSIGEQQVDRVAKFGVYLGDPTDPAEAQKYVLAFVHKLLLQREKIDRGLLKDYLESSVIALWQEVLATLENSNRKFLGVQSGSLIFTLFCPSIDSARELRNDSWIKNLIRKMEQLVHEIGK